MGECTSSVDLELKTHAYCAQVGFDILSHHLLNVWA